MNKSLRFLLFTSDFCVFIHLRSALKSLTTFPAAAVIRLYSLLQRLTDSPCIFFPGTSGQVLFQRGASTLTLPSQYIFNGRWSRWTMQKGAEPQSVHRRVGVDVHEKHFERSTMESKNRRTAMAIQVKRRFLGRHSFVYDQ